MIYVVLGALNNLAGSISRVRGSRVSFPSPNVGRTSVRTVTSRRFGCGSNQKGNHTSKYEIGPPRYENFKIRGNI